MKGDIAFAGFMLTAEEWQALDADSRAQLIAVATRRMEPVLEPPRRFPESTGKHEIIEIDSDCLVELVEDDDESHLASGTDRGERSQDDPAPRDDGDWEDFSDLNEI